MPDKIDIGIVPWIDYRCRRKTKIVQLHENIVARRRNRAGRGCDLGNVGIENIQLRHVRATESARFVFAVARRIEHAIKWSNPRNAERRLRRVESRPSILVNVHGVTRQCAVDVV